MTFKEILVQITSTKGLIIAAAALITVVNELRLTVKVYEIQESNSTILTDGFEDLKQEAAKFRKLDSLRMAVLINDLSIKSGIVVDYSLIRNNTAAAVSDGFKDAIAHNEMKLEQLKLKYEYFILEGWDGGLTLMQVVEREDTVPLIRPYLNVK